MISKLISLLIVALVLFAGWSLFQHWETAQNDKEVARKEAAASVVVPEQLPGLPPQWESSLQTAEKQGASALRSWLRTYSGGVQDPRKAWIELDYCVMVAREDPAEAKRVFAEVKRRTPPSSPIWLRLHELEKSYE